MSNNDYTRHLLASTGRSIARIRQDAKRLGIPLDEMGAIHGIDLPWRSFLDFLKDRDELAFHDGIVDLYPKIELLPYHGSLHFLIGVPGSNIRQSAAAILMIASKVRKNESIGYSDFAVQAKNKPPSADNFKRSAANLDNKNTRQYQDQLNGLSTAWDHAFQYVRNQDGQFISAKVPQHLRFKDPKSTSTIVAYNPRKFAFGRLLPHLENGAILVADSHAESVMSLGSSKHWQQLNDPRCAEDRRQILANTGMISEQRCVNVDNQRILLRRSVSPSPHDKQRFQDKSVSIKSTLEHIEGRMMLWSEAAIDLISNNNFTIEVAESVIRKATSLDKNDVALESTVSFSPGPF